MADRRAFPPIHDPDRFFGSSYPQYAGRRRDYPRFSEWAEQEADAIIDSLQGEPDEQSE